MADKLTKEEIGQYLEAFSKFDLDGDGTISAKELGTVMKHFGQKLKKAQIQALLTEFDLDGNGRINFPEFLIMMSKLKNEEKVEEEMREIFKQFDTDGNGFISVDKVHEVVTKLDIQMKPTKEQVDDLIRQADVDGDGRVNYAEFCKIWSLQL